MRRRLLLAAIALAIAAEGPAHAYSFEVAARTIAQAYQLRSFHLVGADLILSRRRFTQTLRLDIHDIGDLEAHRLRAHLLRPGPVVSFTSYLRLDHDFGDWTMGQMDRGGRAVDAIDEVPELAGSSLALDVMYAYASIDGVAGVLDLRAGRQLALDRFDAWAWDGASARVHTPWHVAIDAAAGLRVRDASPAAPAAYELDGTTGADCREFVEGAAAGTGSWQIIDRGRDPTQSRFTPDLDTCPQREVSMPVIAIAAESEGVRGIHARLAYRRAWSPTVGLIGAVDRLRQPDLGLYPGGLAGSGTNEEQLALDVDGEATVRGVRIAPWIGLRRSLLDAAFADVAAGARLERGGHALEPEVVYSRPIFDGDSIFNAFDPLPSIDARLAWSWRGDATRARVEGWLRRYDDGTSKPKAAGATATAEWRTSRLALGVDGLADGGWGGDRVGATARAAYSPDADTSYAVRAALLHLGDTSTAIRTDGTHGTFEVGATWGLADGVALHALAEDLVGPGARDLRVLAIVDLAFVPEM